jgi:hypothetical protein
MSRVMARLPFTLATCAVVGLAALWTNSYISALSAHWLNRLGFAPRDLALLRWPRLITSALVTDGGWGLWGALALLALSIGLAEWRTGSLRTATTFWGVHLSTLLIESLLITGPLRVLGLSFREALAPGQSAVTWTLASLALARDVGPSAGYFGTLGLVCARLKRPWSRVLGGLIMGTLLVAPILPAPTGSGTIIALSAGLAHMIAFPLGWLSSRIGAERKRP